jgi:nicotinamidase/pyrazinamidase
MDPYSAFYENDRRTATGLAGYLRERGLKRIYLAGLATDYCVYYSAVDARRLGFDAVVIESGCRAIDLAGSLAAWIGMQGGGSSGSAIRPARAPRCGITPSGWSGWACLRLR